MPEPPPGVPPGGEKRAAGRGPLALPACGLVGRSGRFCGRVDGCLGRARGCLPLPQGLLKYDRRNRCISLGSLQVRYLQAPLLNKERGGWDGDGRRLHAFVLERLAGYLPPDAIRTAKEVSPRPRRGEAERSATRRLALVTVGLRGPQSSPAPPCCSADLLLPVSLTLRSATTHSPASGSGGASLRGPRPTAGTPGCAAPSRSRGRTRRC